MAPPAPANIYKCDVDFTALALQYPDFAKKLKRNGQLDFTDPESLRQLSLSLAHRDFSLHLTLPPTRLCPPIPNRFTYILHLQALLDSTSPSYSDGFNPNRQVIGLDIGCGASCIYPLLACRQRERWRMLGSEVDEFSRGVAEENVERNGLGGRIKVIDTDATSSTIIPVKGLERFDKIDFLMTNPPFYASAAQMAASAKAKSRPPNSSCTGAPVEMVYPFHPPTPSNTADKDKDEEKEKENPYLSYNSKTKAKTNTKPSAEKETDGGEVAFITQILQESTTPALKHKIQWFTSMLGHLSSLHIILGRIKTEGCTNYAVWEFHQGTGKTRRWGVAWSWGGF